MLTVDEEVILDGMLIVSTAIDLGFRANCGTNVVFRNVKNGTLTQVFALDISGQHEFAFVTAMFGEKNIKRGLIVAEHATHDTSWVPAFAHIVEQARAYKARVDSANKADAERHTAARRKLAYALGYTYTKE